MDNEMIERLSSILVKHNPQTKIGAAIVVVELLTAMREPTQNVLMKVSEAILACPNASDYERLVAIKATQAMIDAVIDD